MSSGFPGLKRVAPAQGHKRSHAKAFPALPFIEPSKKVPAKSAQAQKQDRPTQPPRPPRVRELSPPSLELDQPSEDDVPEHDPHVIRAYRALDQRCKLVTRLAGGFEHLYQAARLMPRVVGAYVNYDTVLSKGLARSGTYSHDDPEYVRRIFDEYWEVRYYFRKINKYFPGLADHHDYLRQDADLVGQLAEFIDSIAGKTRGDDAGRVKRYIYEIAGWKDTALKIKTERGWNNIITGRLLCPVTLLDVYDNDPQTFCRDIRNRVEHRQWVTGDDWPSFLYDMDEYDPEDPTAGMLKSRLLLQACTCFKLVFTGPESAVPSVAAAGGHKKPKGKPPVIKLFDNPAELFTIYAIIYVACLTRHALNSHSEWEDNDVDFIGLEFVRTVLTLAISNVQWADDLALWYKRRVLDNPNGQGPPAGRRTTYAIMMSLRGLDPPAPPSEPEEDDNDEQERGYAEDEEGGGKHDILKDEDERADEAAED